MNLLKAIIVGSVIFGSALSYAGDGYDRSMKFNEKFRAEQNGFTKPSLVKKNRRTRS